MFSIFAIVNEISGKLVTHNQHKRSDIKISSAFPDFSLFIGVFYYQYDYLITSLGFLTGVL